MIDVKQAVKIAIAYAQDIFPDEKFDKIMSWEWGQAIVIK